MAKFWETFKPGTDLIYGIGEQIDRYIVAYDTQKAAPETLTQQERDAAYKKKSENYYAINTFNVHLTNADYKTKAAPEQVAYIDAIKKSPLKTYYSDTMNVDKVTGPKLAGYRKSNVGLNPRSPDAVRAAAHDWAIRRSCKFGIEYATKTLGGTVHYVLDGMDLKAIAAPSSAMRLKTNSAGFTKIPICTSELRFLFRNWQGMSNVTFWENFDVATPPWKRPGLEDDWKAYAIDRIVKYWAQIKGNQDAGKYRLTQLLEDSAGKITTDKEVRKYLESKPADKVVAKFHRIPADLSNKERQEIV
jgi:hypothetical protein